MFERFLWFQYDVLITVLFITVSNRVDIPLVWILDWTGLDEDEDAHVWEDNWDDDNVEDDFSNQLR